MTPLTKVGKRLDNITRYILDNNPQDKWVLVNVVPMFLETIKSSTTMQEEQIIISQLNKLLDNFEFRYNQIFEEKQKRDRCLRIADRKFDKPSAYKSGAVVRCRKGDIWKDIIKEILLEDESLHKWFNRRGGDGEKGWVDCNTCREVDGKTKCKPCGRKKGEKRAKYPSCRPTPAGCKDKGKGKTWGKTKENMISLKNILTELESNKIYHIEGIIIIDDQKRNIQDVLSDIRALPAITIVRNIEVDQDSTSKYFKSQLEIKIDPYPYIKQNKWEGEKTLDKIIFDIKTTPGVIAFKKNAKPYSTDK